MARLTNFLYCLNSERKQDPKGKGEFINAMGVLTVLAPEFIPGLFSFSIIFSVLDIDPDHESQVKVVFKDEAGKMLADTECITLPPVSMDSDNQLPSKYIGYNLSIDFRNVVFENGGEYKTDIYLNDELLDTVPIFVKERRHDEH